MISIDYHQRLANISGQITRLFLLIISLFILFSFNRFLFFSLFSDSSEGTNEFFKILNGFLLGIKYDSATIIYGLSIPVLLFYLGIVIPRFWRKLESVRIWDARFLILMHFVLTVVLSLPLLRRARAEISFCPLSGTGLTTRLRLVHRSGVIKKILPWRLVRITFTSNLIYGARALLRDIEWV